MNALRSALVATAALTMFACSQKAVEDTSADEAVIRKSAPAWAAAYNADSVYSAVTGNSISYSAQFGNSPAFQMHDGPSVYG